MIKRIGVIGAGQMGSGIAHVCALKGFDIRLMDVDQEHVDKGLDAIGRNMDRQIGRGMIRPEDKDAALHRIARRVLGRIFSNTLRIGSIGLEHASRPGGYLIACSHVSHLDPFCISNAVDGVALHRCGGQDLQRLRRGGQGWNQGA